MAILDLNKIFKSFGFLLIGWLSLNGYICSPKRFQTAIGGTIDYFFNSMIQTSEGGHAVAGFTNFLER